MIKSLDLARETEVTASGGESSVDIRDRIIDAALISLKQEGYAGTSVRAIARAGGFNSALIFYYFGSLSGLLLAALDRSSDLRLARYRAAVKDIGSLDDLLSAAVTLYAEDLEAGHITVFSELVGASLSKPELRSEILMRAEPWLEFVEEVLARFIHGTPAAEVVSTRDLASVILAFYLGANLLTHLADDDQIEKLMASAAPMIPLLAQLLGGMDITTPRETG
jgi:AcrR family transcriptional regulator